MTRSGTVCAPLLSEWAALRSATAAPVVHTGRGPRRRYRAAAAGPVAVAGVAGALTTELRPGDLVVASEIRRNGSELPSPAAVLLHGELRRLGLPARLGPVYSAERVVTGRARTALAESGALAVDTETAFLAADAPDGQAVALRAIVDTPDAPLLSPGTLWRGVRALRSLRAAAPALDRWSAATGEREILLAGPETAARVSPPDPDRVAYVTQTTLAVAEAEATAAVLRQRFPALSGPRKDDICYATTNRQQAVRAVARESDLVLVLGSRNSSNSLRLAEVAAAEGVAAHLVEDVGEVDLNWLAGTRRIGVTAGASAPPHLVDDLVEALSGLGALRVRHTTVTEESIRFNLPREVS
ncbi:hypothetical protein [Nocardia africana]